MRLHEFSHRNPEISTPESNLVTALELLRNRYKDKEQPAKIRTQALINMILNTDRSFDYDSLLSANETNPAVKNLIKSFNRDYVVLQPFGDDLEDMEAEEPSDGREDQPDFNYDDNAMMIPAGTVSGMAKRAAKERGASL